MFPYMCRVGSDRSYSRNDRRGGLTKGPPDLRETEGIVSVVGWNSPVSCFATRSRVMGFSLSCVKFSRFDSRNRPRIRPFLGGESLVILLILRPSTRPHRHPVRRKVSRPGLSHTGQTVCIQNGSPWGVEPCGLFTLRPYHGH